MSDNLVLNLADFQSIKRVKAGEITEVVPAGCYVRMQDGTTTLLTYPEGMTARYMPVPGDFWLLYSDGYQSISPRMPFIEGYVSTSTIKDDPNLAKALAEGSNPDGTFPGWG